MYLPLSLSSFSLFLHDVLAYLSSHLCIGLSLSHHISLSLSLTVAYTDQCLSYEAPLSTTVRRGPLMALNLTSDDGL